jgi:hypothetical protein
MMITTTGFCGFLQAKKPPKPDVSEGSPKNKFTFTFSFTKALSGTENNSF